MDRLNVDVKDVEGSELYNSVISYCSCPSPIPKAGAIGTQNPF